MFEKYLLMFTFCSCFAGMVTEVNANNNVKKTMVLELKTGETDDYYLDEKPKVTFGATTMTVAYGTLTESYKLADVKGFYFDEEALPEKEVNLVHGTVYDATTKREHKDVNYLRSFVHDNWQAFYVPFAVPYNVWSAYGKVAQLDAVSGTAEAPVLEWTTVSSGVLKPNTPYVIKPWTTGDVIISCTDVTLEAAAEGSVSRRANGVTYKLTGIYTEKKDMATSHAYGLSNGEFRPTNDNRKTLSPYQIFLTIEGGSPAKVVNQIDGIVTEIGTVRSETNDMMYDLQGRRVETVKGGIIIRNGNKILKKAQ